MRGESDSATFNFNFNEKNVFFMGEWTFYTMGYFLNLKNLHRTDVKLHCKGETSVQWLARSFGIHRQTDKQTFCYIYILLQSTSKPYYLTYFKTNIILLTLTKHLIWLDELSLKEDLLLLTIEILSITLINRWYLKSLLSVCLSVLAVFIRLKFDIRLRLRK